MKIDESQKKQFTVLLVLILLVVAYGAYKMVGRGGHAASRTEKPVQVAQETGSSESEQAVQEAAQPETQVAVETAETQTMAAGSMRDPFTPQIVAARPGAQRQSNSGMLPPPPLIAQASKSPLPFMPSFGPLRPIRVNPGAQTGQEEDPTRALRLTGVVIGSINVAIFRGEGGNRYIVREGRWINDKYKVESISLTGALIRVGNRRFVLRLGGSDAIRNGARA